VDISYLVYFYSAWKSLFSFVLISAVWWLTVLLNAKRFLPLGVGFLKGRFAM